MSEARPFHRLFGLSLIDFFDGTDITVETEIDLSQKQQFLDLVLIRKGKKPFPRRLPDGFDQLFDHNLVTFKSHQEALDRWAIWELIGHFVNYRKQASSSLKDLIPEDQFRLFAVSARYPANLSQQVMFIAKQSGVYDIDTLGLPIRVIVANQLPQEEQNAMLHLFSAREELVRYGQEHYKPHSQEISTILYQLFSLYCEDKNMSEKVKDFVRQTIDDMLKSLSPEELLKRVTAEERLKGLPVEERLKGLSAEELLRALPPETLEMLTRKIKANGSAPKSE
jgi:hypothetical protein